VQGASITALDCRETFPSLTSICAEDICVDNGVCDLPGVKTVQDAIDALCEESTLRRHKKHLHGWGIVCGLQVDCGPAGAVTVEEGYAIDCDGNDVLVADDESVEILEKVAEFDAAASEDQKKILTDGNGEACLTVSLNPDQLGHSFAVEPYDSTWEETPSLLTGTLLKKFYSAAGGGEPSRHARESARGGPCRTPGTGAQPRLRADHLHLRARGPSAS
jgi:hypothetical protein